jgi:hypothetical protein
MRLARPKRHFSGRLRTADRLIFVWLYRLCPSVREAAVVVKPETLVRCIGAGSVCTGVASRAVVSAGPRFRPTPAI